MKQQQKRFGRRSAVMIFAGLMALIISALGLSVTSVQAAAPASHSAVTIQDNTLVQDS